MSFWAKSDAARTNDIIIQQNFGSGGSTSTEPLNTTFATTTAWTRFTFEVALPSISGKTVGTNSFLSFRVGQENTDGCVLDLWGVQVEAGSIATPFQTATGTIQGELAACQRYYYRFSNAGVTPSYIGIGTYFSTTECYIVPQWPVQMRVAPTVSTGNATVWVAQVAGTGRTSTAFTSDIISTNYADLYITTAADTAGRSAIVGLNTGAANYLEASAEL
jgi:hypothetical protein